MIKRIVAATLILAVLAVFPLLSGCKSPEEIEAEKIQPQIIPDITLNVPVAGEDVVSVNGYGMVKAEPDIATVDFAVRSDDKNAEEAQRKNSELMDAVLAALKTNGVEDKDIQTGYVQFHEQYDYDKDPAVVVGYEMYNSVSVTVRDIAALGRIMGEAIAAGATDAGDVIFSVSDTAEDYNNALSAAMQDAYSKALAIAEAAGCTIEPVPVSVSENGTSSVASVYRDVPMADMAAAESASNVSISTGEIDIEARVTAVYRIVTAG